MRRVLFGSLLATVVAGVACTSDPPADPGKERPDAGEVTAPGADGGDGPPFDVPACVVAAGEGRPDASDLTDDTGSATVQTQGAGCERRFTLSSTAPRKDELPQSPRPIEERAGRPSLQTTSPLFDALYQLALDEAGENSVAAIKDYAFNDGADLTCAEGGCFETGRKWNYVWTRDTAYATNLGLGWVDPIRAKNSLELKISTRRDGSDLQIVQDTGTGGSYPVSTDRAVWAFGAGELLQHLTGEARTKFRDRALEAAKNTIEHDRVVVFDPKDGLYRGEQSFLYWREQTYPSWTSPDTVHIGMSKSLSTNVAHLSLLDLAASLAEETGDAATAGTMKGRANDLRSAIRTRFWLEEDKQLSTFVTTELDPSPVHRFDLLGTSLAVLLDATTPEQAKEAIASYPTLPKGPPVIFPQQKETAIYHNRAIWPFVPAYWVKAAKKVGNDAAFERGVRSLVRGAALNLSNM
ncbi:MAG: Six-hairpin glycosidase-like protein, partial [Labilithrix sp.]|nr:Six-hairpin glycosidase-like protein [Labilithrix sp.]